MLFKIHFFHWNIFSRVCITAPALAAGLSKRISELKSSFRSSIISPQYRAERSAFCISDTYRRLVLNFFEAAAVFLGMASSMERRDSQGRFLSKDTMGNWLFNFLLQVFEGCTLAWI